MSSDESGPGVGARQPDELDAPGGPGAVPLSEQDRAARLAELTALIELMRPAVQADGGDLVLRHADVEAGVVEVQLQGACSSCAISASTLQGGVERILRDRLPWVTEVQGDLDDSMDIFESVSLGRGGYVPRQGVPR
ncbi:MAG: NifU family protein [Acidimicrobiales bacterium]|jgi:Fe-S cluster biogenesis protein NfuA